MPSRVTFTSSTVMAGGAANLADLFDNSGNDWVNHSRARTGTLTRDATGTRVATNSNTMVYQNLLDASRPRIVSRDVYRYPETYSQFVKMTIAPIGAATTSRRWHLGILGAFDVDSKTAIGVGVASASYETSATSSLYTPVEVRLTNGALNITANAPMSMHALFGTSTTTLACRIDPYQVAWFFDGNPPDILGVFNPISTLAGIIARNGYSANSPLTYGISAFSSVIDAANPAINSYAMSYYVSTPRTIYADWREHGASFIADLNYLNFGANIVEALSADDDLGGYDVIVPKLVRDGHVKPKMMVVDNRSNPCVVDIFVGPARWRVQSFTEAEIPFSDWLDVDVIGLRGGGTQCGFRIFGQQIQKTFRQ